MRTLPAILCALACGSVFAQPAPIPKRVVSHPLSIGPFDGGAAERLADTSRVRVEGARWIRVFLSAAELGHRSYLIVRADEDPQSWQRFDAAMLAEWSLSTAVFRGEAVTIELHVAPDDRGVYYRVVDVWADAPYATAAADSCGGPDTRFTTTYGTAARLWPAGCTTWLVSNGAALTAGHCVTGTFNTNIAEFDVPPSDCGGYPMPPPASSQYPVRAGSVKSEFTGQSSDWAVYGLGRNATTRRTAAEEEGFYRIVYDLSADLKEVQLTGFGSDAAPAGCTGGYNRLNLTQMTSVGALLTSTAKPAASFQYTTYSEQGTSGGPVSYPGTMAALGIHGGSNCLEMKSYGTGFGNTALTAALQSFLTSTVTTSYVDAAHFDVLVETGSIAAPYRSIATAIAKASTSAPTLIAVTKGNYEAHGFTIGAGKTVTIVAPTGDVVIGPVVKP